MGTSPPSVVVTRAKFAFSYPKHGWVSMALMTNTKCAVVVCSDVFDPFTDLVKWLAEIKGGTLPAQVEVNEECPIVTLTALPSEAGIEFMELTVVSDGDYGWTENPIPQEFLRATFERAQFVDEFAFRFEQWLATDYDPRHFKEGQVRDLRDISLSSIAPRPTSRPMQWLRFRR